MHHELAPKLEAEDAPIPQQHHAYRSVDVAARRSSRAWVNFRPRGTRRSGSIEPILAPRAPDPEPEHRVAKHVVALPACAPRELAQGSPSPEGRGGQGGEAPACPRLAKIGTSTSIATAVVIIAPTTTRDRKSTRLNSSHVRISYAVF